VPIAGEPPGARFGKDRSVVVVQLGDEMPDADRIERLRASGAPIFTVRMDDATALGGEFFRWEMATAVCGWLMRINPFDEPNVQQAKDATRALLDTYASTRRLPAPEPHESRDGIRFTLSTAAESALGSASPGRFLDVLGAGDYLALLAFVSPNAADLAASFARLRQEIGSRFERATMFGYGPRYLHSTGQLHKGGPNTGVFVVILATPEEDLAIPGEPFSFGVLEAAQAIGDFQSLEKTGRRALLIQLPRPDAAAVSKVADALLAGR